MLGVEKHQRACARASLTATPPQNPAEFTPLPCIRAAHSTQHTAHSTQHSTMVSWWKVLGVDKHRVQCVSDTVAMRGNVLRWGCMRGCSGVVREGYGVQQCRKGWANTQHTQVSQATWRTPLTEIENASHTHALRLMYCLPRDPPLHWPTKSRYPIVKVATPVL